MAPGGNESAIVVVALISGSVAIFSALVAACIAWVNGRKSDQSADQRAYIEEIRKDRNDARAALDEAYKRIHDLETQVKTLGGVP